MSSAPSWSPDGRLLAVLGFPEPGRREHLVVVTEKEGKERLLDVPEINPRAVAWLDAHSLVLSASQLWRITFPDGAASRLTNDLSGYGEPSIARVTGDLATSRSDARTAVWLGDAAAASGADLVPASSFPPGDVNVRLRVAWAGGAVLYTGTEPGGLVLSRVGVDGSAPAPLVPAAHLFGFSASADGGIVVFTTTGDGARLWRTDGAGHKPAPIAAELNAFNPLVSADGRDLVAASSRDGANNLWWVPLEDGTSRRLTHEGTSGGDMRTFGNTASLAFTVGGARSVVTCDLPDCINRRTMALAPSVRHVRWTPDGTGIAYIDAVTERNIWIQPLGGNPPRQLTRFTDDRIIADFAWSHDGKKLAIARATVTNDIVLFKGLR